MSNEDLAEHFAPIISCWKNRAEKSQIEVIHSRSHLGLHVDISGRRLWVQRDGGAIIGDRLVCNDQELADLCSSNGWYESAVENMMQARGSVCLYLVDENASEACILPDPLGACLLYRFDDEDVTAYSSDLRHLVDWLAAIGKPPKPSIFYFAMVLSTGSGAYGHSSYEGVTVLPAHTYLQIIDGAVNENLYPVDDYLIDNNESYETLLKHAEDEIRRNVRVLANSPKDNRIAHLTGGFDTRLVLSAILAEKVQDKFRFMCSGPEGTIDRVTSHGLALKYNLTMTKYFGLEARKIPEDQDQKSVWGMEYSAGMRLNCVVNDGHDTSPSSMIVSGGYGECIRSFYSHNMSSNISPQEVANAQWSTTLLVDRYGDQLMKPLVSNQIGDETCNYLKDKLNRGWSMPEALDLMYLEQRNRYHIGNIATLISRKTLRIDPLYSLAAIKAAMHVGFKSRQINKVGFDLMSSMAPELPLLKFGGKKFSEEIYKLYPGLNSIELPNGRPRYDEQKAVRKVSRNERGISRNEVEKANKINGSAWQVYRLKSAQNACKNLLYRNHRIFEVINERPVARLLSGELNNRVRIRHVHFLHSILRFMA